MRETGRGNLFRKLFYSFFLLMNIFFVIFLTALYGQWESARQEKIRQESLNQVNMTVRILDEKFSEIDLIASQVSSGNWFKYVSAKSDILYSQVDIQKKQEICQLIGNQNDSLGIAKSTAVFLPYRNLVVDRKSFWESERYFTAVGMEKDTLNKFLESLEGKFVSLVMYTDEAMQKNNGSFGIIRRIGYGNERDNLLFVYIDGRMFSSFMRDVGNNLASVELIYEENGIYDWNKKPQEGVYEKTVKSEIYNWLYRVGIKEQQDIIKEQGILLILFVFLSAVIMEFVLAWKLADFSISPILSLMDKMEIRGVRKETVLDDIEKSWKDLNEQKEWMEVLGNQYYKIAETVYLSGLLKNTFDQKTAEERAKAFGLPFREKMYIQAMLFLYSGTDTGEFQDAMLKLQIRGWRENVPAVFCKEESVLLLVSDKSKETVTAYGEQIRILMDEEFPDLEVEVYAGMTQEGFQGISRSYREGKEKQYLSHSGGSKDYYYPLEIEMHLIHSMRTGNFGQTKELISQLEQKNEQRVLVLREQRRVVILVSEVLWRFAVDINQDAEQMRENFRYRIEEEEIGQELWKALYEALEKIKNLYEENADSEKIGHKIVSYVEEHFTEASLSQQDIADIFGVSRSVVSRLFKETTQTNFVDYLRKKRVMQAKFLFDMGEKNLMEVAHKSGYADELTFKRAFMRCEGMTPKEYVNMWNHNKKKG